MKIFSLIPARSGSKRIPDKNLQYLGNETLLQIAVKRSNQVEKITGTYVVTDSELYESHAIEAGARSLGIRPSNTASDDSPDKSWLNWSLNRLKQNGIANDGDIYIILRATSPFRTSHTICSAIDHFMAHASDEYTCLRSVRVSTEHPGKMWRILSPGRMQRVLPFETKPGLYWSDSQAISLPTVHVQNASIEVGFIDAHAKNLNCPTSGFVTIPFVMSEIESIDINTPLDLQFAKFIYDNELYK